MRFTPAARARLRREPKAGVRWFGPLQLLRTAPEVAAGTIFGRNADARLIEALSHASAHAGNGFECELDPKRYDFSRDATPFWIDYVSDTGDGWDATYTVAYYVAQDELRLASRESEPVGHGPAEPENPELATMRGRLLIFGGDEVYPFASRDEYDARLVLPYACAFPNAHPSHGEPPAEAPRVFAIPGNHDWYDSLTAFTRLFCAKAWFAGWFAPQERSYFALKLPANWWLVGTDIQLGHDIDGPQRAYFEAIARRDMRPGDRIILCHAEPHWIYETIYPGQYDSRTIRELEAVFCEQTVAVFLAGDLHHYRRHENAAGIQKIVAGGGGAFLHLTDGPDDTVLRTAPEAQAVRVPGEQDRPFLRRKLYPSWRRSWWLCWATLGLFYVRNGTFGLAAALAYFLLAASLLPIRRPIEARSLSDLFGDIIVPRLLDNPFSLFLVVAAVGGIIFFTDTHSRTQRLIGGFVHAAAHLAAAVALSAIASVLLARHFDGAWYLPLEVSAIFAIGYVAGSFILALYLTLSLNLLRRHTGETSSALASPDYRNFLRLKIDESGELTIYPVGIRRAATHWDAAEDGARSRLRPLNGTRPFLIEEPLHYPPRS